MDWQKIQDALIEWFQLATGLPVMWYGEDAENTQPPFGELQVTSSTGLGIDERRETYDDTQATGEEVVRTQFGNRLFMLNCRVETRDHRPARSAHYYLEKVRTALFQTYSQTRFRAANLAVVGAEPLINLDTFFNDRQKSEARLDIRFATIIEETDPRDRGGFIDTVLVTSDILDPGGDSLSNSLQMDDQEMPP